MVEVIFVLEICNLYKCYGDFEVFKGIFFIVCDGDVIFIFGLFGLGKFIFLCCINLLENLYQGQILVFGEELCLKKSKNGDLVVVDSQQINWLCSEFGFVFQNFNLWLYMSIFDNVIEVLCCVLGKSKVEVIEIVEGLLVKVGIVDKCYSYFV